MVTAHCSHSRFYWFNHDFWISNGFNAIYLPYFLMKQDKNPYRDLILSILLLGLIYWFKRWDVILVITLFFVLLGLAFKTFRLLNYLLWKSITQLLQLVFQPIIGGVVFFLVLTPLGLLSQLFKKKKADQGSTFVNVDRKFDIDFFKKQW